MTDQQTDIEKTLKRILARELKEWPNAATHAVITREASNLSHTALGFTKCGAPVWSSIAKDFSIFGEGCGIDVFWLDRETIHRNFGLDTSPENIVTRAEWEAERALLAYEQAQPLGDSEEFDQALWDKVATKAVAAFISGHTAYYGHESNHWPASGLCDCAADYADAFMAERAKRIAARKASHD